ncbi:MerR family transcriptional regulator [Clostridium amazonitimonense]|uniref:MerR family transcriptional regulator n=1 Tax=Clostridium amazonitimonense TaxID=1499689 RepID=UPI000A8D307D|nr:MerR family transcriptional regulator [Clostridium amazonitimonense]
MTQAYDEIGLLKPVKVELFTGYRMYSAEQIPVLQKIVLLSDTKFTTLEIKDIIQRCN